MIKTCQYLLFCLCVSALLFLHSCVACKERNAEVEMSYILLLKEGIDNSYLQTTYASEGFQSAARSSRSENKWEALFKTTSKKQSALEKKLKADANIVSLLPSGTSPSPPTNDTNDRNGKSQPKK